MNNSEARTILRKPYTRILIPDEESGTFTAQIIEFPGCLAQGATPAEAYERLEAAAESWIEAALEMQQEIPSPASDVQFSGRFVLRLPRSLHRQVAQLAELEGTSLNQFIVGAIAEKVGALNFYRSLAQQLQASMATMTFNAVQSTRPPAAPSAHRLRTSISKSPLGAELNSQRGPTLLGQRAH
jgi:predicted RNase H-like HicB family nuclease